MLVRTIWRSVWLFNVAVGAKPRPPPPPARQAAGAAAAGPAGAAGAAAGAAPAAGALGSTMAGATAGPPAPGPGPPARGPGKGRATSAVVHVATHFSFFDCPRAGEAIATVSRAVSRRAVKRMRTPGWRY